MKTIEADTDWRGVLEKGFDLWTGLASVLRELKLNESRFRYELLRLVLVNEILTPPFPLEGPSEMSKPHHLK